VHWALLSAALALGPAGITVFTLFGGIYLNLDSIPAGAGWIRSVSHRRCEYLLKVCWYLACASDDSVLLRESDSPVPNNSPCHRLHDCLLMVFRYLPRASDDYSLWGEPDHRYIDFMYYAFSAFCANEFNDPDVTFNCESDAARCLLDGRSKRKNISLLPHHLTGCVNCVQ